MHLIDLDILWDKGRQEQFMIHKVKATHFQTQYEQLPISFSLVSYFLPGSNKFGPLRAWCSALPDLHMMYRELHTPKLSSQMKSFVPYMLRQIHIISHPGSPSNVGRTGRISSVNKTHACIRYVPYVCMHKVAKVCVKGS